MYLNYFHLTFQFYILPSLSTLYLNAVTNKLKIAEVMHARPHKTSTELTLPELPLKKNEENVIEHFMVFFLNIYILICQSFLRHLFRVCL